MSLNSVTVGNTDIIWPISLQTSLVYRWKRLTFTATRVSIRRLIVAVIVPATFRMWKARLVHWPPSIWADICSNTTWTDGWAQHRHFNKLITHNSGVIYLTFPCHAMKIALKEVWSTFGSITMNVINLWFVNVIMGPRSITKSLWYIREDNQWGEVLAGSMV